MRYWILNIVGLLTLLSFVSCTAADEMTPASPTVTATSAPPTATAVEPTATPMPPSPTPEESPEEPMEATPTSTPDVEEAEAPSLESNALAELESYRAQISWQTNFEDGTGQEMMMDVAETRDPEARQISISGMGMEIEFISMPDASWVNVGDQWQRVPGGNLESFFGEMTFLAPEDVNELATAEERGDYEFVGTETVNGIQTRHYRIDIDSDELTDVTEATSVNAVEGDVWVADEDDLPSFAVRMTVQSEIEVEGKTGTSTLIWDVLEVNTDLTIEPPEGM